MNCQLLIRGTVKTTIERVRPIVYQTRLQRIPPGLDDKVITAWNGMMIGTMAEAARVLGNQRYLDAATRAADFLLTTLSQPGNRLLRTYRKGKAHLNACLEDYAYLSEALIDLYEAGGEERYLHEAVCLAERIVEDFSDPRSREGSLPPPSDHESLILRSREGPDGATPSGNAVAASASSATVFSFQSRRFSGGCYQGHSSLWPPNRSNTTRLCEKLDGRRPLAQWSD